MMCGYVQDHGKRTLDGSTPNHPSSAAIPNINSSMATLCQNTALLYALYSSSVIE